MSETKIEWAHYTHNPWWGCTRIGPECDHCYAEAWAKRTGHAIWGHQAPRRFFGPKHHAQPHKWNRDAEKAGERRRVFCASMADVFERLPGDVGTLLDAERARLWVTIEQTPWLDWMLLTKRPENMLRMVPMSWHGGWPANAWAGTTAGTQRTLERNLTRLMRVPARTRFLSMEPLLEEVEFDPMDIGYRDAEGNTVDLVIVGAESGGGRRPMDPEWVRNIRNECVDAGIAFFFKQDVDHRGRKVSLPMLDARRWAQMPEARA